MSDPTGAASRRLRNPFVGPRAFRKGELFFGREAEKEGLLNKLLPGGVTLLYSPSGAGKTSLIQAAIVPELGSMGFQICGASGPRFSALRVNLPPPPELQLKNRYVFSVVNGLVGHLVRKEDAAVMTIEDALDLFERRGPGGTEVGGPAVEAGEACGETSPSHTAAEVGDAGTRQTGEGASVALRARRARAENRPQQLVVVDQLEEILTLNPSNTVAGREEFFRQLGYALRRGRRWALLSMREDYIGRIDKYRRYFQNELRTTFRIDLLDTNAALRAIQRPAAECGVVVEDDAAQQLVDDLRRFRADEPPETVNALGPAGVRNRRPGGRSLLALGRSEQSIPVAAEPDGPVVYEYVEPVLLQVICDSLWRILNKTDFTTISKADLARIKPYKTVLSKYYRQVVREAARKDSDTERAIRDWVEQHLITKNKMRRPTLTLPPVKDERSVVEALQRRYLIRDDPRPGGVWRELAHDMLVPPIVADNRAWRSANLQTWQVVADEWHRASQPYELLLTGQDLLEARSAARRLELTQIESNFFQESVRAAHQSGRLASMTLQRNLLRALVVLSVILNIYLALQLVKRG